MRNSRWSTKPITKNGQIVGTKPHVDGDIEILRCLGRHPLLTLNDLAALTARPYESIKRRINKLKRVPLELVKVHDTQRLNARQYQWASQALHLTRAGIAHMNEIGLEPRAIKSSTHFIHTLTESQTAASFEVGAKLAGLKYVPFSEIVTRPGATRLKPTLPVRFNFKGKEYDYELTPDGEPFVLVYPDGSYRCICFESDMGTEPLSSSNKDRQAIELKFAAYLDALTSGAYEQWGVENLTVLFTTTSKTRLDNMRDLLASMTTENYRRCFRFYRLPTILMSEAPPPPGWAVTLTGLDKP